MCVCVCVWDVGEQSPLKSCHPPWGPPRLCAFLRISPMGRPSLWGSELLEPVLVPVGLLGGPPGSVPNGGEHNRHGLCPRRASSLVARDDVRRGAESWVGEWLWEHRVVPFLPPSCWGCLLSTTGIHSFLFSPTDTIAVDMSYLDSQMSLHEHGLPLWPVHFTAAWAILKQQQRHILALLQKQCVLMVKIQIVKEDVRWKQRQNPLSLVPNFQACFLEAIRVFCILPKFFKA